MRGKCIILSFFVVLYLGCSTAIDDDYTADSQIERIESYIDTLGYKFTSDNGLYITKLVTNNDSSIAVDYGDSLYINFVEYYFYTELEKVVYTNILDVAQAYGMYDPKQDYVPFGFVVGEENVISGLSIGVNGAKEEEELLIFMTSDYAYGEKEIGAVPSYSSVAFNIEIYNIVKNDEE